MTVRTTAVSIVASLLGGRIALFVSHPTFMTAQAGKLRALFAFAPARLPDHPNVPTLVEQGGPPLSFEVWGGIAAPKGIPAPALAALENACKVGSSSEVFRKRMETLQRITTQKGDFWRYPGVQ